MSWRGCVLVAVALGCGCDEPAPKPSSHSVTRRAPQPTLDWRTAFQHRFRFDADRSAVVVDITVAQGFHAYTVGESIGRPLKLALADNSDVVLDGAVEYPEGTKKDTASGPSVVVQGKASIVAKVKPRSGSPKPNGAARGQFSYQVCTEKACDRPKTVPFSVPAVPRPAVPR